MELPANITITEVGPRDGFQNIAAFIPTETKLEIIELLIAAGVKKMEVTSFVHPKAIAQMADAAEVAKTVCEKYPYNFKSIALVPNLKGAENALKSGIQDVTYVISASEKHNLANVNRTVQESLEELKNLIRTLPELKVRLAAATSFGCPFLGKVPEENVLNLAEKALASGVNEVVLCDTIGVANPRQVDSLVGKVRTISGSVPLGLHLHDTMGRGLANTLAGMGAGIAMFETSVGGLGGCPFAPGAAGNTATEDTVDMLHAMGIETGIRLAEYLKAVATVKGKVNKALTGRIHQACRYENI